MKQNESDRYITKIAHEASKFVLLKMKSVGIGTGEYDFIHTVRHNPGITQAKVREILNIDKGAAARRTASLEEKGYLIRRDSENDRRCKKLYATEKAETLNNSKVSLENDFYGWLLSELSEDEQREFKRIITKLYEYSKKESRSGFPDIEDGSGK